MLVFGDMLNLRFQSDEIEQALVEAKSLSCQKRFLPTKVYLVRSCKKKFILQDLARKSVSCKILERRSVSFKMLVRKKFIL